MYRYRNSTDNANVALGKLVITARTTTAATRVGCCEGGACKAGECLYSSARLRTYGKFSVAPTTKKGEQTVRIATRVKVPVGTGLWPAIWLLPENSPTNCSGCGPYGPWGASGAITIAQMANTMKNVTGGIAYGGPYPKTVYNSFVKPYKPNNFHEFVLEWSRKQMTWYLDNKVIHTAKSSNNGTVPGGWYTTGPAATRDSPFDRPFYIIANFAVGGSGTGNPSTSVLNKTLKKPKSMQVDYIRVCKK